MWEGDVGGTDGGLPERTSGLYGSRDFCPTCEQHPARCRCEALRQEAFDLAQEAQSRIAVAEGLRTKLTRDALCTLELGTGLILQLEALRVEIRAASCSGS
jgi:hypothetical protein